MEKSFHFVDTTQNDKASRRQVRRFVMKGKNAGKTVHRPSRMAALAKHHQQQANTSSSSGGGSSMALSRVTASDGDMEALFAYSGALATKYRDMYPTFSLPVKVAPHSLKIINQFFYYVADRMYPAQLGISLDDAKCMWLPVLFADEASILCNVAMMQACNEIFLGEGGTSPKALYYLSQTFVQVRKRLESNEALSDSTIGIVLSLINQEQIRREHLGAKVHIDGLRRMVELRGGLDKFESNLPLLLKICKTDILFALQHGGPTLFFRDRMPEVRERLASRISLLKGPSALPLIQHNELDPCLREIFLDAMTASSIFNNFLPDRAFDLITFQEMQVSICYRLFQFSALQSPKPECDIQAAYHIGLTIFMMTLFLQFDCRRMLDYQLISLCFKDVLSHSLSGCDESGLGLWLTLVGGIWLSGDIEGGAAYKEWLSERLRREAEQLGVDNWDEALIAVRKFPWIHTLHDKPGRVAWNQAHAIS